MKPSDSSCSLESSGIRSASLKDRKRSGVMYNGVEEVELLTLVGQSSEEAASNERLSEGIKTAASDKMAAMPA